MSKISMRTMVFVGLFLMGFQVSALELFPVHVPSLQLEYWNSTTSVLHNNNCYNYSTNRRTDNFAQPGESSGQEYTEITCAEMSKAVQRDLGVYPVDYFNFRQKQDYTLIALVVGQGWDFHWYRRDDNGYWSHKPGSTPATTLDRDQKPIVSPETANRGRYKHFCGYFAVRNWVQEAHEQNSGFVRIGNMKSFPPLSGGIYPDEPQISTVELLLYSGRRNPKVSLKSLLTDPELAKKLQRVPGQMLAISSLSEAPRIPQFEYAGAVIDDREGLVFPKGTRLTIAPKSNSLHSDSQPFHYQQLQPGLADLIRTKVEELL